METLILRYFSKWLIVIIALSLVSSACMAQTPASTETNATCGVDALGVSRTIEAVAGGPPASSLLSEGEVILTFDDGPHPRQTRRILDVLDQDCVRAAFFLRGDKARRHRKLTRQIIERGHRLGGHGWAHADLTKLSPPNASADIVRGINGINRAFRRVENAPEIGLFRFPFVATNQTLSAQVTELGLAEIGVDIDGADWTDNSAEDITDLIMSRLQERGRRGIILLHDPFENSVEATRLLLARLKAENYAIVELVPATTP